MAAPGGPSLLAALAVAALASSSGPLRPHLTRRLGASAFRAAPPSGRRRHRRHQSSHPSSPTAAEDAFHRCRRREEGPGSRHGTTGVLASAPPASVDDGPRDGALDVSPGGGGEDEPPPSSGRARRERLLRLEELADGGGGGATRGSSLSWDSFDFGDSPKMDGRFSGDAASPPHAGDGDEGAQTSPLSDGEIGTMSSDSDRYRSLVADEAKADDRTSRRSLRAYGEMSSLSPDVVARSIAALAPYVRPRRLERIDEVLSRRTGRARFLFENPSNPSNVWACLRTLDSFGVQHADVIVDPGEYDGKAAVMQKRGMRTAMGSAVWMTVRQFGSADEALGVIRDEEGCAVYASDLGEGSADVRDLRWDGRDYPERCPADPAGGGGRGDADGGYRPVCIVMGNEDRGISEEMRDAADATFRLPMVGFAESFNLSVATAVTLAYMSAASGRDGGPEGEWGDEDVSGERDGSDEDGETAAGRRRGRGPLCPGGMDPHFLEVLRLRGMIHSLAQKRTGRALLKREGIVLPQSMYE